MRGSRFVRRTTAAAALAAVVALVLPTAASAGHGPGGNRFVEDDVVSDQPGAARLTDPNLVNAWGLAALPTGPLWVVDNGTNRSSIYPGTTAAAVTIAPLVVDTATDGPTGIVANTTSGFKVGGQASLFVFDSEAGDITAWSPAVPPPPPSTMAQPAAHVDGAIFKGLAMLDTGHGASLYAADFHHGRIDVFDDQFHRVPTPFFAFRDFFLPRGYAPFNVQALGGKLYVSYAKQDADAEDEIAGPGRGFVDVYNANGVLLHRLVSRGFLDAPWGMAIAPKGFGRFGGDLLVGNFGDGRIHAYDPHNGHFEGTLRGKDGRAITIDGLWGLRFGNGVTGTPGTLIFSAGPDDESHGLVGFLTPSMS
jgi:uncharacterized protein (TIGR03118 family)